MYYLGDCYEIDETPSGNKEKLYLAGENYYDASAVLVKDHTNSWKLYYIGRDYLGSITDIITEAGTKYASYNFDAWGRQRNSSSHVYIPSGQEVELFLGRGYSGHEHLKEFGLVNMNARLYDPALGRFLAPDPFVQMPDLSQNFNRYSYAMNNPLRYVDEDGEFIHIIIGAVAHVGIACTEGELARPMLIKGQQVTVTDTCAEKRTADVLIAVAVPLHAVPAHVCMNAEEMPLSGLR